MKVFCVAGMIIFTTLFFTATLDIFRHGGDSGQATFLALAGCAAFFLTNRAINIEAKYWV